MEDKKKKSVFSLCLLLIRLQCNPDSNQKMRMNKTVSQCLSTVLFSAGRL